MGIISLKEILELAIATERAGAAFYERMARAHGGDEELGEVFSRLSLDERAHEIQFRARAEEALPGEELEGEGALLLRAAATSHHMGTDAFTMEVKSAEEALILALNMEKATLFYYQAMRDVQGSSPRIEAIIGAERGHVAALMRVLLSRGKFRSMEDPWP